MRLTILWKLMGTLAKEARAGLVGETKLALLTAQREIREMRRDAPGVKGAGMRNSSFAERIYPTDRIFYANFWCS